MTLMNSRGRNGRTALRVLAVATVASGSLLGAASAQAASTNISYTAELWPSDFRWDGGGNVPSVGSTGYASVDISQPHLAPGATPFCSAPGKTPGDSPYTSCDSVQLRGGAVVPFRDKDGNSIPSSAQPGDTIEAANGITYADDASGTPIAIANVFASATIPAPQPVISSVIGANTATIARTADAVSVGVSVYRRVARTVTRDRVVPGTYSWVSVPDSSTSSGTYVDTCQAFNSDTQSYVSYPDTAPPKPDPSTAGANRHYILTGTQCTVVKDPIAGAPYEQIQDGRITSLADGSYTVTFAQPLAAGDLLDYWQTTDSLANDVDTSFYLENITPVGVVPPPPPADVTAPKVQTFDFGAASTSVKSFKKSGILTFIALDEPSTVSEVLTATPAKEKAKKGKKKSKKKSKTSKAPVVIATGTGATTGPGQTARVPLVATKDASKLLKGYKGKPVHATLTTTITDTSGNKVTSTSAYTLTA